MKLIANVLAAFALSTSFMASPGFADDNIKQPDIYGCGPAAAANCVGGKVPFYNGVCAKLPVPGVVKNPRDDWGNGTGGVTRWELCQALNDFDDNHDWTIKDDATLKDLQDICAGPGKAIVLVPAVGSTPGHFVTVCEVVPKPKDPGRVIVTDPATGNTGPESWNPKGPFVIIYPTKPPAK